MDQGAIVWPGGLGIEEASTRRQVRLDNRAKAKAVLEARAQARSEAEQAEDEAQSRARQEKANHPTRRPGGKPPQPGPRDKDQSNFTAPDSRVMKNRTDDGFDPPYNGQVAVDPARLLMGAERLSNQPKDKGEAEPTLAARAPQLGQVEGAAPDNGYFSPSPFDAGEKRGIEPYIATGRPAHQPPWLTFFAQADEPPADTASPKVRLAFNRQMAPAHASDRLRKCTVEPVIGRIKDVLGFRQFSLRGLIAATGAGTLVCLAFNLKRWPVLCPDVAAAWPDCANCLEIRWRWLAL